MQLLVTPDSTTLSYWLNWRVLVCAIWVFVPVVLAIYIIRKCENVKSLREKTLQERTYLSCCDVAWRPCLDHIHPIWLLAYRVIAFCFLFATLAAKVYSSGFHIFFFYTQWTFTLVTIYFGYGALLSMYGCYRYHKVRKGSNVCVGTDAEQGFRMPLMYEERSNDPEMKQFLIPQAETHVSNATGMFGYLFQVVYQISAGAVMYTDLVYWSLIFPYFTVKDYAMSFMTVNMHSLNAVLLLLDTALNSLPFPWFRISYFILWTGAFVTSQWILHACVLIWWPYPFLNLSSPHAPLWYLLMACLHLPCYGIFVLITKLKQFLLSKWCAESYQYVS